MTKKLMIFSTPFYPQSSEIANPQVRQKYGQLEGCVRIVGNVALSLIKLICGLAINSVSLIADAFHTLTDVITSVIIIISFRLAQKPGDQEHPFGMAGWKYCHLDHRRSSCRSQRRVFNLPLKIDSARSDQI